MRVKSNSMRLNQSTRRFDLLVETVLIFLSLLVIIPLLIMIFGSFKSPAEAMKFNALPPSEWFPDNYVFVFTTGKILRAMINSFIVTSGVLIFCVGSAALAGFILARTNGKMSRFFQSYFMAGMVAPMQIITTFAMLKFMNIIGTHIAVILVMAAVQLPWSIFMFVNFIKGVPRELDEASFIDGAGPLRTFFFVILPTLKPIMATTIVMTAMFAWNEFMIPLYFFNNSANWTMPLTVYNFFGQYFSNWNYVFANLVLTALPVTILYLYAQKYIVSGLTAGSVKG
jgi:raffinose/stachyose/melibiose transport system permease protein